jgi:hypothetical protein
LERSRGTNCTCGVRRGPLAKAIKDIELDLGIVLARVQAVEIGNAVDAEQHGFAIEHERAVPVA